MLHPTNHVCSYVLEVHVRYSRNLLRVVQCCLQLSTSLVDTMRKLPAFSLLLKLLHGLAFVDLYCFGNRLLYSSLHCADTGTSLLAPSCGTRVLWDARSVHFRRSTVGKSQTHSFFTGHVGGITREETIQLVELSRAGTAGVRRAPTLVSSTSGRRVGGWEGWVSSLQKNCECCCYIK